MSWMQALYETYENCISLVGKSETDDDPILFPIAHTTQNAHIEIMIDMNGNFLGMPTVITDKNKSVTIIPCTEKSQSRSGSNPIHHPLFDKLQYLAGDYNLFGGEKGVSFHENYIKDLEAWCSSPFMHQKVCAILKYLKKDCLIDDLVKSEVLFVDENKKVIRKWKKEFGEKRGVFMAGSVLSDTLDAFVRINVHTGNTNELPVWSDPSVWDSYIGFYLSLQGDADLCYVQGKVMPCSDMSPSKIRGTGDKAKLISSNDKTGFTYRGRFDKADQLVRVGYLTTQKAHNALKWLIRKQGLYNGDQVFVIWGTRGEPLPSIEMDSLDLMMAEFGNDEVLPDVQTEYAEKVKAMMSGYARNLTEHSKVVILGLDSATTGRLSVINYQELWGSKLLLRLQGWYESCAWILDYKKGTGTDKMYMRALGTPSPKDIIFAVYGRYSAKNPLFKSAMQRLMPCILDNQPIPLDFMRSAVRRASSPNTMETWEYRKTLAIACAIIRKYYIDKGVDFKVGIDYENHERSYLFGRVLAYYNHIEQKALDAKKNSDGKKAADRPTNALQLKYQFFRKPEKTLKILDQKITPYLLKDSYGNSNLAKQLYELLSEIDGNNCENFTNAPLDATYLLGFSSQMTEFYTNKKGE
ncbi:MAG: type I-C CRISPR-associated protein Cas8c/Csd1 [Oscillospiraceae bacterium]